LMPPPRKGRGRRRTTPLRVVVNAIFYIAQSGCQWRMLPKDFPPFTTVQRRARGYCRERRSRKHRLRPAQRRLVDPRCEAQLYPWQTPNAAASSTAGESILLAECSAKRARMSADQADGSASFNLESR